MAIAIIAISGVAMASGGFNVSNSGSQSTVLNGQTNSEAVMLAQKEIEKIQSLGRQDFGLITNTATTSIDSTYYKSLNVTYPTAQTALVSAVISWRNDHNSTSTTMLSTLIANLENVNAPTTCNAALSNQNGWKSPVNTVFDFQQLLYGNNSSGLSLSDIHIFNKKMYVSASAPPSNPGDNETFFILDASNAGAPVFLGSVDNNLSSIDGMNAVTIASSSANRTYAYVGNARDANFYSCLIAGPSCSELQIIDATNPSAPVISINFKLSTSSAPYVWGNTTGPNDQATGKSVFYKDGYLYLGLTTTQNGPAFHIINVSNPLSPVWVGSWPSSSLAFGPSGAPINSIYVKGNYAYLAHPNGLVGATNEQMTILDISNPSNPVRVSGYGNSGGIGGNGKAVWPVGNRLYLGRTASNISGGADTIPEFYILDDTNPTAIPNSAVGSSTLATSESVNNLVVLDNLAFLLTTVQFKVLNISNPSAVTTWGALALPGYGGGSFDCEGERFFIVNDLQKDHVSIVSSS